MESAKPEAIVLDANIVFDLDSIGYLGQMLRLGCPFHTTDLVERELRTVNAAMMRACGVVVGTLSGIQMVEAAKVRSEYRGGVSIQDASAYVYAHDNGFALATRDSGLWQAATDRHVVVYETPGIMAMMIDELLIDKAEAARALNRLNGNQHVRRLDWDDLVRQWRKQ